MLAHLKRTRGYDQSMSIRLGVSVVHTLKVGREQQRWTRMKRPSSINKSYIISFDICVLDSPLPVFVFGRFVTCLSWTAGTYAHAVMSTIYTNFMYNVHTNMIAECAYQVHRYKQYIICIWHGPMTYLSTAAATLLFVFTRSGWRHMRCVQCAPYLAME